MPHHAILPIWCGELDHSYLSKEIRIIDDGETILESRVAEKLYTYPAYRSPETYFQREVIYPADVWAFAC